MIDEKTHHILDLISEDPRLSQRTLALKSGVSVGLINLMLKRLMQTGYIKISNLNKKKAHYFLTTKGFLEKTKHSYRYLAKTIGVFQEYRRRLSHLVEKLHEEGNSNFVIVGQGEVADLLKEALASSSKKIAYRLANGPNDIQPGEYLLDCRWNGHLISSPGVSILSALITPSYSVSLK